MSLGQQFLFGRKRVQLVQLYPKIEGELRVAKGDAFDRIRQLSSRYVVACPTKVSAGELLRITLGAESLPGDVNVSLTDRAAKPLREREFPCFDGQVVPLEVFGWPQKFLLFQERKDRIAFFDLTCADHP